MLTFMLFISEVKNFSITNNDVSNFAILLTLATLWKNYSELKLVDKIFALLNNNKVISTKFFDLDFFKTYCRLLIIDAIIIVPSVILILSFELSAFLIVFSMLFIMLIYNYIRFFVAKTCDSKIFEIIKNFFDFIIRTIRSQFLLQILFTVLYAVLLINVIVMFLIILSLFHIFSGSDSFFSAASNVNIFSDLTLFFKFILSPMKIAIYLFFTFIIGNFFVINTCAITFFYNRSKETGEDLKADIAELSMKKVSKLTSLILISTALFFMGISNTSASEIDEQNYNIENKQLYISIDEIKNSIDKEKDKESYNWNEFNRKKTDNKIVRSLHDLISKIKESLVDGLKTLLEYVKDFLKNLFTFNDRDNSSNTSSASIKNTIKVLIILLVVAIVAAIIIFIIKILLRTKKSHITTDDAQTNLIEKIDLEEDHINVKKLQVNQWRELAKRLENSQQYRLALRAYYLSIILVLAERELLILKKSKTDYEYLTELSKKKHIAGALIPHFKACVQYFQKYWYGDYRCEIEQLNEFKKFIDIFEDSQQNEEENND